MMEKEKFEICEPDDSINIYELRSGKYQKKDLLGKGSFGRVLLVEKIDGIDKNQLSGQIGSNFFALKISKRIKINGKNEKKRETKELTFIELRELNILRNILHVNLLHCLDFKLCNEESWILMEYYPNDLGKFFKENINNPKFMNEEFLKSIALQILTGVNYMHENMYMHRDLKLENILYDEKNNIVKIGDFGLSRPYDFDCNSRYTDVGTLPYKSPELLLGMPNYSVSVDIWSLGCILAEICIGGKIFGDNSDIGVLKLIISIFGPFDDEKLPGYKNFPLSKRLENLKDQKEIGLVQFIKKRKKFEFKNDDFFDLLKHMLCINPIQRFSAQKCLSHRWLESK